MQNDSLKAWRDYSIGSIRAIDTGTGEPLVVMLHGWGSSPESFLKIIETLKSQRRIIAPALPGFAGSPEPAQAWGVWDYVETVKAWLDEQGIERADFIGHSHGGRVSIGLAVEYPQMVNSLVLIGSAGLRLPPSLKLRWKRTMAKSMNIAMKLLPASMAEKLRSRREQLGSEDWRAASPVMRQTLSRVIGEDMSDQVAKISAPTCLIWGANDDAVPVLAARRMNDLIAGSKLTVIAGAGHYCFLDKPGDVISLIWEHLGLPKAW